MFYYKYTVENLHSPYTSDKCMRAGILMAVFKVNMSTPAHWYHLDVKAEMERCRRFKVHVCIPAFPRYSSFSVGRTDSLPSNVSSLDKIFQWFPVRSKLCWSCLTLATPRTVTHQAPLSMGFPDENTGVGCHALLQRIFLTQGSNVDLLRCRQIYF